MRRIWKDQTILMLCVTVFLSYLPEAGQYSCFFVYLRLVMDFSKVFRNFFGCDKTYSKYKDLLLTFLQNYHFTAIILGGCCNVYRSGRNLVSNRANRAFNLFNENIGIKTYNHGRVGF